MKIFHFPLFLILLCSFVFLDTVANAEQPRGVASKAEEPLKKKISNLSEPNKFFTGRETEVKDIAIFLAKNNILVIEGLSGIGKTQLAKQYAHSFLNQYDLIWWFDSEKSLETQIDGLLSEIFLTVNKPYYRPVTQQDLIKKLKQELSILNANWLLIFDNIEDLSSMNQFGPFKDEPFKGGDMYHKHVIVTHQKMDKTYPTLMIDKFQRKDSVAFLSKILKEETEEALDQLANALEDLPLALMQAASYIKMNPSVNVETYLKLFREHRAELWKSEDRLMEKAETDLFLRDHYNKSMVTAIKMNIDSLKKQSPLAYDLLCLCSLLHHHHIPFEVLENWACKKREASQVEFHEALSLLLNYFVLEKENKEHNKKKLELFNQHELIQLIATDAIDTDTKKIILQEAAQSLVQELVNSSATLLEQFQGREYFYEHMEKVCNLSDSLAYQSNKINELRVALLYYIYFIHRDFNRAADFMKSLSLNHWVDNSRSLSSLAQVWFYCTALNDQMFEDLSEVEKHYAKALKYIESLNDQETKRNYLLHIGIDYAESLSNFGKIKEAVSLCDRLKEIVKLTANDSQKPSFLGTSALIRLRYGQYDQSLEDLDACFEIISKEKNHQYMPFFMLIKSHCLLYLGHIEKAYELVRSCYSHLLEVFTTPDCAPLVNAQLVRGACLVALGKLDEALSLVQKSLEAYEKSSGFDNDVQKGMGYRILGEIFEAKDNFVRAHEEYTKAENLYETILQEKTLDDLGRLYTRLAILGVKLGDDTQLSKYLSLHIENFGLAHPRTFEIKKFLDDRGLVLPSH